MLCFSAKNVVVILLFVDLASCLLPNLTKIDEPVGNKLKNKGIETRRNKKKKSKSTSSSGSRRSAVSSSSGDKESLNLSPQDTSSSSESGASHIPKSTEERKGWRKWHRKCTPCPEDMPKKWRDPSIQWICGGYQRARRSFKSLCMMHYRNCQDGTMFVKIHDHRCKDDKYNEKPHGNHFLYDYKVRLSDDSSSSSTESLSDSDSISDSGSTSF